MLVLKYLGSTKDPISCNKINRNFETIIPCFYMNSLVPEIRLVFAVDKSVRL